MQIEIRSVASIIPYNNNPRVNDDSVDAVVASLREFGFRQPIVVDGDGVIIVGHTRYKAAQKMGLEQVPLHVATDLSPDQIRAYRIADNKSAELSEWDYDLLPIELASLREANYGLGLLGFDADELARLLSPGGTEGLCDPDEVPEPPDDATTQPGDLWVLGDHRLLCGDSTIPDHIERLMNGQTARMLFTDPPWNVGIGQDSNPRHRQRLGLKNDKLSAGAFREFLDGFVPRMSPAMSTASSAHRSGQRSTRRSATTVIIGRQRSSGSKTCSFLAGRSTTVATSRSGSAGIPPANRRSATPTTSMMCGKSHVRNAPSNIPR